MTCTILLTVLIAGGAAGPSVAGEPQASIPFVNQAQSIRSWQADRNDGIWIQDARNHWYYAQVHGPCFGLEFAVRLGFETRTSDSLDRFGAIVVPGVGRCQISSLTRSSAPQRPGKR